MTSCKAKIPLRQLSTETGQLQKKHRPLTIRADVRTEDRDDALREVLETLNAVGMTLEVKRWVGVNLTEDRVKLIIHVAVSGGVGYEDPQRIGEILNSNPKISNVLLSL